MIYKATRAMKDLIFRHHSEDYDKLNHPWIPPTHSAVKEPVTLRFYNIEVQLLPDGTYNLSDISGG